MAFNLGLEKLSMDNFKAELDIISRIAYEGKKRVGIIGGSGSGIISAKEQMEVGNEVLVFEVGDQIGGVFLSTYPELRATGSSTMHSYGAFSTGTESFPVFSKISRHVKYLNHMCDHFNVRKHIMFQNVVTCLSPVSEKDSKGNELFKIVARNKETNETKTFLFHHIIIASGAHTTAEDPTLQWKGRDSFKGEIVFASEITDLKRFENREVLVVGGGEYGADIFGHVSKIAKKCCMNTRCGPGRQVPRYTGGLAVDIDTSRSYHGTVRVWDTFPGLHNFRLWLETLYVATTGKYKDDIRTFNVIRRMNKETDGDMWGGHRYGTKSENIGYAIAHHRATYMQTEISELTSDRVNFKNGESFTCNSIILCTGYDVAMDFVDQKDFSKYVPETWMSPNPRKLYKRTIHPDLGLGIGFCGFARPAFGAFTGMSEMQARYYAALVSGRLQLPSKDEMKRVASAQEAYELAFFPKDGKRLKTLTNYAQYMCDMAKVVGCEPPMKRLFFTDPRLWYHLFCGQLTPLQFRIFGLGRMEGARELVLKIPVKSPVCHVLDMMVYAVFWILYLLGFESCKPPL